MKHTILLIACLIPVTCFADGTVHSGAVIGRSDEPILAETPFDVLFTIGNRTLISESIPFGMLDGLFREFQPTDLMNGELVSVGLFAPAGSDGAESWPAVLPDGPVTSVSLHFLNVTSRPGEIYRGDYEVRFVPEPSAWSMLAIGLLVYVLWRIKR